MRWDDPYGIAPDWRDYVAPTLVLILGLVAWAVLVQVPTETASLTGPIWVDGGDDLATTPVGGIIAAGVTMLRQGLLTQTGLRAAVVLAASVDFGPDDGGSTRHHRVPPPRG